jgi:hypothetical protein
MKDSDIKLYEISLKTYSEIMSGQGRKRTMDEIKECLETFERLEDYDKCKDLLNVIKMEVNNKNVDK